jgi:hypothetical protein
LALIPEDDHAVRTVVLGWADSVPFKATVGRLCDLSKHSTKYDYNSVAVPVHEHVHVFVPRMGTENVIMNRDIIIRPTNRKGPPQSSHVPAAIGLYTYVYVICNVHQSRRYWPHYALTFFHMNCIARLGISCIPRAATCRWSDHI